MRGPFSQIPVIKHPSRSVWGKCRKVLDYHITTARGAGQGVVGSLVDSPPRDRLLHKKTTPLLYPVQFCLENTNDLSNRLALSWVALPTSLDHFPRAIGKFGVVGSARMASLHHRVRPRNLVHIGE